MRANCYSRADNTSEGCEWLHDVSVGINGKRCELRGLINIVMITVLIDSNVVSGKGPGSRLFGDKKRKTQRKGKERER